MVNVVRKGVFWERMERQQWQCRSEETRQQH
jgi:hypothetical protein